MDKQTQAADRLLDALGRRVRGIHGVARTDERRAADHDHSDLRASCFFSTTTSSSRSSRSSASSSPRRSAVCSRCSITDTPFSVSSMIGFLALFGVSVQTAVVYISYANELRLGGFGITEATRTAALLRLRPIMMTALVAALGPAPGRAVDWRRLGHAEAVRAGDRRRTLLAALDQRLPHAGAVRDVRARRRPSGGVTATRGARASIRLR